MVHKNPRVDLRGQYKGVFEKALILSLAIHLFIFLTYTEVEVKPYETIAKQVVVEVQDIPETQQLKKLPPPPRPSVPIESESEDLPEDVTIETTDLRVDVAPPPPPPPMADEFVAYDTPPKLIRLVKPKYPDIARKAGIEGMVILKILVDVDGKVIDARVLKSLGNVGCDEAALEAAKKCLFEPALQRDKPVKVWVSYPVRFILKDAQ
ncbi:energy transducer TonB [bacterium]|nr:energy transducer TonB [bacterium]